MFVCVDIVCTGGMYCFIGTELKKKKKKKVLQKKAVRIITGASYNAHTEPLFKQIKKNEVLKVKMSKYMFALNRGSLPRPLAKMVYNNNLFHAHNTRNANQPQIIARTTIARIKHFGPTVWYTIHIEIRDAISTKSFNA